MLAGQQFGRYEIRSKIGEGGMGEVYAATDPELGRSVAIKLLPSEFTTDPDRRSRFRQEARVVSALNHPNILTIYEIGENEHGSFLATEFVEGRTLREVIKNESITLPRILRIVEQAANALVAAHAARIVHRDIKPENIMVRRDSIVKVLDFGLAKPNEEIIRASNSGENKTVPGTVMGSARYMSPEQARGQELDERTDIWSLGIVLYEMLTGRVPFDGESTAETLAAVIYKEPDAIQHALPNAPPELQRILRKALQKDREERYQSVKDFALDIKGLLYDIEHASSGDRTSHVISSPEFSENPTMIHRTVSGNHPTNETNALTAHYGLGNEQSVDRKILKPALAASLALLVLAAAGFGVYSLFNRQLSAGYGEAFENTQVSRINSDGKVLQPAISPDGRYIAYVSGEIGRRSIVVRQIATNSIVTVVPETNLNLHSITFSPDGDFVYYLEMRGDFSFNSLYHVPTLGGKPRKLIEDVDSAVTFSPDGKRFAFMRHAMNNNSDTIYTVDTETLALEPLISTENSGYSFFSNRMAWSPDGRRILAGAGKRQGVFVTGTDIAEISVAEKSLRRVNRSDFYWIGNMVWLEDGSGFLFTGKETMNSNAQVWRTAFPEWQATQVTNDSNDYQSLSIAADGRTIVTAKGDTVASIWQFTPATKNAVQLTGDNRNLEGAGGIASPRGGKLVFTRAEGKKSDIWTSDADGKNAHALLSETGYATTPAVTPDGRYIVFNLQKDKSSRIWRMDADGKNLVQLTEDGSDLSDFNPQITPDGRTVVFERHIPTEGRNILAKVGIDGGPAVAIFDEKARGGAMPRISPDGSRIAFVVYDVANFSQKLNVARFENGSIGRAERELDYNLVNQYFWSPDGKSLTVLSSRGGIQNLWKLPADGSAPSQITDFRTGRILNFAWAPDGKSVLIARGNTNNDLILIRDTAREAPRQTAGARLRRPERPA